VPSLSICIPVKNRSRIEAEGHVLTLLPKCIQSLGAAVTPEDDWQIVVADFESDDWPLNEWLDDAAAPIPVKVMTIATPFSCGHGLNVAAANADAPILLFLSTDMLIDRATLLKGIEVASAGEVYVPIPLLALDREHKELRRGALAVGTVFISKELFGKVGDFPEFKSHGLCDTVWAARADAEGIKIVLEDAPGLIHQWHPYTEEFSNRHYPDWKADNDKKLADWNAGKYKGSDKWPM